ncbi:MAG TPA: ABC transporter permease [Stellaceae bacterium]|jgi:peptide/nickel transport system permease protein
MRALHRNPSLCCGGLLVGTVLFVAMFHGWLAPYAPEQMDMARRLAPPSVTHWLGTDNFGRDLATRLAYGAGISLSIALGATAAAAIIGTGVGLLCGYCRGAVDLVLMRVVDIVLGFPSLILVMALVALLGPGPRNLTVALAAVFWTQYARVARAAALSERERDYILAAEAIGLGTPRILLRHLLPNIASPLIVLATLGVGVAIVSESGLSFLGLGVQPPTPSWGWTLAYGLRYLRSDPWMSMAAGLTIMITVTGFNLLGDGLRDLLDPRAPAAPTGRWRLPGLQRPTF